MSDKGSAGGGTKGSWYERIPWWTIGKVALILVIISVVITILFVVGTPLFQGLSKFVSFIEAFFAALGNLVEGLCLINCAPCATCKTDQDCSQTSRCSSGTCNPCLFSDPSQCKNCKDDGDCVKNVKCTNGKCDPCPAQTTAGAIQNFLSGAITIAAIIGGLFVFGTLAGLVGTFATNWRIGRQAKLVEKLFSDRSMTDIVDDAARKVNAAKKIAADQVEENEVEEFNSKMTNFERQAQLALGNPNDENVEEATDADIELQNITDEIVQGPPRSQIIGTSAWRRREAKLAELNKPRVPVPLSFADPDDPFGFHFDYFAV